MEVTMNVPDLFRYFFLPIFRPSRQIHRLYQERAMLGYSLVIYLFLGVIYTVTVQIAYVRGFGAMVDPFLKIPAEDYYFWQRFFQIPLFLTTVVVFAGTGRLLAAAFKGSGSFEKIFALCCVAMTFPMFLTMWLPETVLFLIGTYSRQIELAEQSLLRNLIDTVRQIAGIVWPMVIICIGITISEKMKWIPAAIVTVGAMIPTAALMVIFIR
jgi:hypothetical protein